MRAIEAYIQMKEVISSMIDISDEEYEQFIEGCSFKEAKRKTIIAQKGVVPNEIIFIIEGLLRVVIVDQKGLEHTIHFAMENQFIADYSSFIQAKPSVQILETLENTSYIAIPRSAVKWGYDNLRQGDRLGRFIAEYYFMYQDDRINNQYLRTPQERYEHITQIFPNIHNRAPQHMIASYLGITSVHLSRLKKNRKT